MTFAVAYFGIALLVWVIIHYLQAYRRWDLPDTLDLMMGAFWPLTAICVAAYYCFMGIRPALRLADRGIQSMIWHLSKKQVHADKYGILFTGPSTGDDRRKMMVQVTDPANGRTHWLRVDPHVRTAKEAVASTFGLSEAEYAPEVET